MEFGWLLLRQTFFKYLNCFGYKSDKIGEQTQFFQVISVENNKLIYSAYTTLGNLYDKAIITKDFSTGEKTISNSIK